MRKIVVSDIHGSFYTLQNLLTKVNFDPRSDKLICLGDMCDRGKNSNLVFQFFYNLQQQYKQHIVLLGNHEDMLNLAIKEALYTKDEKIRQNHCFRNGGLTTLQSFYPTATKENSSYYFKKFSSEYKNLRKWLKSLPTRYESEDYFFVHAGVDFSKSFWNQTHRDMVWIREPFLSTGLKYDKPIFHGHTPVKDKPFYEIKENRINIDGGCVYGGKLNIVVITENDLIIEQSTIDKKDIYIN